MPTNKPERWEIQGAYDNQLTHYNGISAVAALVNERWQAVEAERERGRMALSIVTRYAQHFMDCGRNSTDPDECTCGLSAALEKLCGESPAQQSSLPVNPEPPKPAEWEYATGDTAAPWEHDVDAFNREQRARREAYAQGLVDGDIASRSGDVPNESCRAEAARRYPLKKREPRIMPDPHGKGEWCFTKPADRFYPCWRKFERWLAQGNADAFPTLDGDRIRALAALLDSPFTYVDDTTPEQEST